MQEYYTISSSKMVVPPPDFRRFYRLFTIAAGTGCAENPAEVISPPPGFLFNVNNPIFAARPTGRDGIAQDMA